MSGRREADSPVALRLLKKLDSVTAALRRNAAKGDDLMRERNELFVQLKAEDVTHREIASHADLTEMAVKKAIDKTTREAEGT